MCLKFKTSLERVRICKSLNNRVLVLGVSGPINRLSADKSRWLSAELTL